MLCSWGLSLLNSLGWWFQAVLGLFVFNLVFNGGVAFLHSSLEFIVVVQVAILAFAFRIDESIRVRASIGIAISAILMIAVVAHTFSIMLLVFVRAFHDFHGLSFLNVHAFLFPLGIRDWWVLQATHVFLFSLIYLIFRVTIWFWLKIRRVLRVLSMCWVIFWGMFVRVFVLLLSDAYLNLGIVNLSLNLNWLHW